MPDVLAQDDVMSPQYDVGAVLSGSRYDAGPPPGAAPTQAAAPLPAATGAPPPPVAPLRPPTDMRPEIAQERQRAQAAFDAAERSMAREESDAAAREKELAPLRQRQMQMAMSSIDRTEAA